MGTKFIEVGLLKGYELTQLIDFDYHYYKYSLGIDGNLKAFKEWIKD